MRCPCLSGDTYDACCGPLLAGDSSAPTAERLMRSRFTAFAVGDADHLLRSWHPSTRPSHLELDDAVRWTRLEIFETEAGGPFDTIGFVSFEAFYREEGTQSSVKERSRFVREDRVWSYVDGAPELPSR
ncbi:YchJ family protein [Microbacterium sp. TWP3-1-2b2]|uniref:YchJ family protein n=1 Tax=Microbacterium sp. TWP3-1-2b2 TaxID=2804651 RepID=UPI003CF3F99F